MSEEDKDFRLSIVQKANIALIIIAIILIIYIFRDDLFAKFNENQSKTEIYPVIVNIEGAVNNPGVYQLTSENRISDAINIAGGLNEKADIAQIALQLNKAQKLKDEMKIIIPYLNETGANYEIFTPDPSLLQTSAIPGNNELISINNASKEELDSLPGIGEITAEKIINNRPYSSLNDMLEKKVINKSQMDKIKDLVSL